MVKLIAADLDGTLMPYGRREISNTVTGLISEALDRGLSFAVSSGRTYSELKRLFPSLQDRIYFIACDGACCIKGDRLLYGRHISREDIAFFAGRGQTAPCIFHGAGEDFAFGDIPEEYREAHRPVGIDRISALPVGARIYKITSFARPLRLPMYTGMRLHWNDAETGDTTQYVSRFCNKGAALSDLENRLFLSGLDTAVIGDADNDLPMFRGAKLSFAVGSRSEKLLAVATHKVRCAEEALRYILATL